MKNNNKNNKDPHSNPSSRTLAFWIGVFALGFALASVSTAFAEGFAITKKIPIIGQGSWDYLAVDEGARRLYVSHGTQVEVLDVDSGAIVGKIENTPGVHGIAIAPELGRGFVSNGQSSTVTIFDLKTLKKIGSVKVGERPDAILYEPFSKRVFTFNARSQDSTVIDAASGKVAGTVALGGKPEFPASDGKGKVYVNIEDKSQIAEIDVSKLSVVNTWSIAPCEEPSALAFDVKNHRLFAGCGNKMMALVNSDSGKVVTTVPIGEGVDAGRFNPNTQQVFMSCGEGVLTVIHEDSPDKYTVQQNLATVRGARTMALDQENNVVYLVTAQREDKPVAAGQRPTMVPGSFELIVVKAE